MKAKDYLSSFLKSENDTLQSHTILLFIKIQYDWKSYFLTWKKIDRKTEKLYFNEFLI